MTDDNDLVEILLRKTAPLPRALGGVTCEHDKDCVEAANTIVRLKRERDEFAALVRQYAEMETPAFVEALGEERDALTAQLDKVTRERDEARRQRDLAEIKRADTERMFGAENADLSAQLAKAREERDEAMQEIERLKNLLGEAQEWRKQFDCCMCGSPMDGHSVGSGHSPVSMYDYHRGKLEEELAKAREVLKACVEEMTDNHPGSDSYWSAVERAEALISEEE